MEAIIILERTCNCTFTERIDCPSYFRGDDGGHFEKELTTAYSLNYPRAGDARKTQIAYVVTFFATYTIFTTAHIDIFIQQFT